MSGWPLSVWRGTSEIEMKNGYINVPNRPGLGFEMNTTALKKMTLVHEQFT